MLEILDIFFFLGGGGGWGVGGWTVDAGPEPTYEEKLRVPHPPGCLTSGGAADAVEIEIKSYCVENWFTHIVSSRSTTDRFK